MRRSLAPLAIAAVLRAAPAVADPMDLNLERLGAPAASIWQNIAQQCLAAGTCPGLTLTAGQAATLARESQQRYRTLAMQLGLGLTAFLLDDPTTGGALGFEVGLEAGQTAIRHPQAGASAAPFGPALGAWPVRGDDPSALRTFALHVQKGLPWSFDLGGRIIYLDQSQTAAAQAELRWALNENYWKNYLPDIALRGAYTRLLGQRDLTLGVIDVDAVVGKRFGVGGSVRLTPYGAVRFTMVSAQTTPIDFAPNAGCPAGPGSSCFPDGRTPAQVLATTAPFADVKYSDHRIFRYAVGGKLNAGRFTMALELSYYPGKKLAAKDQLAEVLLPDSLGGAVRLGLDY
jgi:hypothetical protein